VWISRSIGLVLAASGAGLLVFLLSRVIDRAESGALTLRLGIPGVLFLALVAQLAFAFGMHLLVTPRSAVRRRTVRRR